MLAAAAAQPAALQDIRRDATVAAVEEVMPCVVNIATETIVEQQDWYEQIFRRFYGLQPRQQRSVSLGSGVIIDEEGYVLTNFHVVRRASRIQVKLWDGREYEAEAPVATEGSDVALLKILAKPGEKFKAIKLAADDDLLLGETVVALGNPFGLGGSVSKGILSSKARRPSTGNEPLNVEDWLQTDAAINPGNSGGPLINLRSELIGLNVAVYREQDGERGMGIGFSIPIRHVSVALSQFFTPEVTDSLWFGARMKLGAGPLSVATVVPGSPAAKAGLKEGDLVTQLNGRAPGNLISFNKNLVAGKDRTSKLAIQRDKQARTVTVNLVPFEDMFRQKLGLELLESSSPQLQRLGLPRGSGLYVQSVDSGSPAEGAQIQKGMVITGINQEAATSLRLFGDRLAHTKPGDEVVLRVMIFRRVSAQYVRQEVSVKVPVR